MSTPQQPPPQQSRSSSGGFFTRKMGPLPVWGWAAIVFGLILIYSLYKGNKSKQAQSASTVNQPGGVDASLVPQFINQTYDNDQPPTAPNVTINNQVPLPPTTVERPPPVRHPEPMPATISGEPGSYTTGLPGGLNEWTSNGRYSLNTIAKSHGMTTQQLIAASEGAENNVPLKKYVAGKNFNKPVPAGVQLFIPNANWKTR